MAHNDPSEALNAITAPDSYTPLASIQDTPISRILIDVVNQPIYWQLKRRSGGSPYAGDWEGVEVYMLPGSRTIQRSGIVGIRVRAAIPAAQLPAGAFQAVVTVEAVK